MSDDEADWLPWYREVKISKHTTRKMFVPRTGNQLVAKHRNNTSRAGFPVNLLISALQKYIRRTEEGRLVRA